jgi:NADPH-dependent 2,4-dienoyl-CoA reductase/sulfur reductase-like enzyme
VTAAGRLEQVAIVGGGLAALRAAEALRREGYDGRLALLSDEADPPYDRPPLSKAVLTGEREPDSTVYRTPEQLAELDLDVRLGTAVDELGLADMTLRAGGQRLKFDGLVIASGARARTLPAIPPLAGVHVLRTLADARALLAALGGGPRVVVAGAGFIGSEVAASARALGLDVTIVEAAEAPMTRVLGPRLGAACAELHRDHGTKILCGAGVAGVDGEGALSAVRLTDGTRLPADVLVVGVGAAPNTEWLAGSGLPVQDGVICDGLLRAGHPRVLAAGDVARWTDPVAGSMRSEHWTNAVEQGRHAARNLLAGDGARPFRGSGFVWSDQYGQRLQFVGSSAGATDAVIAFGSVDERRFLAFFVRGDRLAGAFSMNATPLLTRCRRLVDEGAELAGALGELGLDGAARVPA